MKIVFQTVVSTRDALRVGLVLKYSENGPIRFAELVVRDDDLDWEELGALHAWLNRQYARHLDRERECSPEEPLPGL